MYSKENDSDQLCCRVLVVDVAGVLKLWRLSIHQLYQYGLYVHVYVMEWDTLKTSETVLSLGLLSLESFEMALRI